jgi:hypothetical protein
MFDTPLQRLRKSYALADLPDTIAASVAGDSTAKPIEQATVDDVAFATQALTDQANAIYDRAAILRRLHDRARRAGALGSALAVDAAAQGLEGAR